MAFLFLLWTFVYSFTQFIRESFVAKKEIPLQEFHGVTTYLYALLSSPVYSIQLTVKHSIFYKHVSISITRTTFIVDSTPFGLIDIDVNLRRSHTHRTKTGYKDCKVSWKGEKRSYTWFYGESINKPYSLRSAMRASRLLCQVRIEWNLRVTYLYVKVVN